MIETRLALVPVVKALARKDLVRARRLAKQLKVPRARAVAEALLDGTAPNQTPSEYAGDANEIGLTDLKPAAASVGWDTPTFDRVPENSVLLESTGEIFATGIYALAPARHEYALGGRWETFSGKAGIATGHAWTVQFESLGDGRSLWRSATVRPEELVPFEANVRGVQKLELLVSPTDDGNGADWGLWLEPQLLRSR